MAYLFSHLLNMELAGQLAGYPGLAGHLSVALSAVPTATLTHPTTGISKLQL